MVSNVKSLIIIWDAAIKLNHQTYDSMTYHMLSIKNIEQYAFFLFKLYAKGWEIIMVSSKDKRYEYAAIFNKNI